MVFASPASWEPSGLVVSASNPAGAWKVALASNPAGAWKVALGASFPCSDSLTPWAAHADSIGS